MFPRFAHRLVATVLPLAAATLAGSAFLTPAAQAQTAIMFDQGLQMDEDLLTLLDTDAGHLLSGYEYPFFRNRLFDQTDADHNGSISAKEFADRANAMFAAMDADNDGFLTKEEIDSGHKNMLRMMYKNPHAADALTETLLARSDADHDGRLSTQEYLGAMKARFEAIDLNHDGTISRKEFEGEHRPHKG